MKIIKKMYKRFYQRFIDNNINLVVGLSLILLFFNSLTEGSIELFLQIFIIVGIVARIATHYFFWVILTLILAYSHLPEWYSIDNHIYLMMYWTLTLSIALYAKNSDEVLAKSATLLLGLCFLFATFWKIVTPDFMNGSFFQYLLSGGDGRFDTFSMIFAGTDSYMLETNKGRVRSLMEPTIQEHYKKELILPNHLYLKALFMTWWTVILEGLIAILFLFDFKKLPKNIKHFFLLTFIITTYPIANVITFALLLVCIAISQVKENRLIFIYLFTFLVLHFLK